jgi:apoptosis-inducing factor 2
MVTLSTGRTIAVDEYISTAGVISNNQFIPKGFLTHDGLVNVDEQLRLIEDGISRSDSYALGGITCYISLSTPFSCFTSRRDRGVEHRRKDRRRHSSRYILRARSDVPVGQSMGTGHLGGWSLFGCLVWFFKGKDFLTYEAPQFL